jgi:hypothetical protein
VEGGELKLEHVRAAYATIDAFHHGSVSGYASVTAIVAESKALQVRGVGARLGQGLRSWQQCSRNAHTCSDRGGGAFPPPPGRIHSLRLQGP